MLGVDGDKVRTWIARQELRAHDCSETGGGRPRWRVSDDDLQEFLARRATKSKPKPRTTRRKSQPEDFVEYV
jgi:hypothetical protein